MVLNNVDARGNTSNYVRGNQFNIFHPVPVVDAAYDSTKRAVKSIYIYIPYILLLLGAVWAVFIARTQAVNRVHVTPRCQPAPPVEQEVHHHPTCGIQDFVRTLYKNILDRDAESQEVIDEWTQRIHSSGVAHVVGDFFMSPEYRAKSMSTC
ncbi:hypothetical protein PILCRDRAFT_815052 [Piloderma croceum F 1598]|uniref:DUF4214 domain-containing protein n=1 Tax=Piloderma croceum (strain F 1598) TaxID=765440 RepID=A0A0C3GA71_PILCF|nr:hypothetical protein PILCRDRAFT_815052 [Piloderma croceum F 1598]